MTRRVCLSQQSSSCLNSIQSCLQISTEIQHTMTYFPIPAGSRMPLCWGGIKVLLSARWLNQEVCRLRLCCRSAAALCVSTFLSCSHLLANPHTSQRIYKAERTPWSLSTYFPPFYFSFAHHSSAGTNALVRQHTVHQAHRVQCVQYMTPCRVIQVECLSLDSSQ